MTPKQTPLAEPDRIELEDFFIDKFRGETPRKDVTASSGRDA